jgi:anti-sigma factor RsiW
MEAGIHELTAGYALDALDPDERSAYEAHLAQCEHCRQELASFWTTTEALAVAASGPAPSPALRDRILVDVRAEPAQNVVPFEPRRRRVVPVLGAAAAVAAVVALGIGLWASNLSSELDETRSALEQQQTSAAILADPESRTVALQPGAEGRLVVDADGQAVLVVDGLDPAPAGKTYQLWIVPHGGAAESAGLFPGTDGLEVLPVDGTVETGEIVAVTIEQAGGVDVPTMKPIVGTMPV